MSGFNYRAANTGATANLGPHFKDPRLMPRWYAKYPWLDGGNAYQSDTFWTKLGQQGVTENTDWTAGSWKTLLSVSGNAGQVAMLIGPSVAAVTDTTTWEITVDGVETTLSMPGDASMVSAARAFLGHGHNGLLYTSNDVFSSPGTAFTGNTVWYDTGGTNMDVFSFPYLLALGTPLLVFEHSLLVRCQLSASQTATTNRERRAGVMYRLL